jgi:hypothetical protein
MGDWQMSIQGNRPSVAGAAARLAIILSLLLGCAGKSGADANAAEAVAGADAVGGAQVNPAKNLRVLFLGNSLTYTNDIPLIVQALAKAAGQTFYVEAITFPNFNLEDQWNHGEALRALETRKWDYVVLQQGPSSLPESQEDLRRWTRKFAPKIRQAGAKPALYMVWPDKSRMAYFDDVRESYSQAAADVKGTFIPAGEVWRAAWRRDADIALYSYDDFHPSVAGSYAAALSIDGMLSGRSVKGLPAKLQLAGGHDLELPAPLAKLLQEAATEADLKYGRP